MTDWATFATQAPEFAARVRTLFDAGRDKTIATLRKDGSPRISGIELEFLDGEVQLGMMGGSRKLDDVRRDPRVAVHSPTLVRRGEEAGWSGDARLSGVLREYTDRVDPDHPGAGQMRLDISEVVLTRVENDRLVVESWRPDRGYRRQERGE